ENGLPGLSLRTQEFPFVVCLKVRYGEELEEVRADKQWACPHCIDEKGTKPYWICNSSLCLQKRKWILTWSSVRE
ncbi:hypothetical protein Leryth_026153, partial [Lithospermum erythrorhizon]